MQKIFHSSTVVCGSAVVLIMVTYNNQQLGDEKKKLKLNEIYEEY